MGTINRLPTGDVVVSNWSKSSGTDPYYSYVDDLIGATDGDTYVHNSFNSDSYLSFSFPACNVPVGATNIAVKVWACGVCNVGWVKGRIKVNGSYYESASQNTVGSWNWHDFLWSNNPNTGSAWTVNEVNTLLAEIGIEAFRDYIDPLHPEDGRHVTYWTHIFLEVTYTDPITDKAYSFSGPGYLVGSKHHTAF